MKRRWLNLRVEARMALGLATLFVGVLLMLDLWVGLSGDRQRTEWELRRTLSETMATTVAQLMQAQGGRPPLKAVQALAARQPRLRAVALRDRDGQWLVLYGDAATPWPDGPGDAASMAFFRVPILRNGEPDGELHLAFHGMPGGLRALAADPFNRSIVLLGLLGGLAAYLYLRRVLHQIDPQQAIPQRVRAAFDVLGEGVLMLDPQQRVMLVNEAFTRLLPPGTPVALGQPVAQFEALMHALAVAGGELPWRQAQRTLAPSRELVLRLAAPPGSVEAEREVLARATPVLDDQGRARGTLVSLADVSTLHRLNRQLQASLSELAQSRDELELRNQDLTRLATRDPMTGCLNRRSFFELAERALADCQATAQPLCCLMIDIDHFKRINDSHGHAVGDAVIIAVAQQLGHTLRKTDLLCRYGGEEFCLLLPARSLAESQAVAERLREHIEQLAGPAASQACGAALARVTASIGVAEFTTDVAGLTALIERADMGLYVGKRTGRNRVSVWSPDSVVAEG